MKTTTRFYIDAFLQNLKNVAFFTYLPVLIAKLGASPLQISLSNSLPALFCALSLAFITRQLPITYGVYFKSGIMRQFAFLCMAFSPLLPHPVFWLLFFWAFNAAFVMITSVQQPTIIRSVMSDESLAGLFSRLKNIAIVVTIIGSYVIGRFLDGFQNHFPYNYVVSMVVGAVSTFTGMSIIAKLAPRERIPIRFHWVMPLRRPTPLLTAMLVSSASIAVMNPVWTVYHVNRLHLGNLQIGLFGIASGGISALLMPIMRRGLERFGPRRVIMVTCLVMAITPAFYTFVTNYWYLLLWQTVMGVSFSFYDVAQQTLAVTESKQHSDVVGFMSDYQLVQNLGNGLAPILAAIVIDKVSVQGAFYILAALKVLSVVVIYQMLNLRHGTPPTSQALHIS